MTTRAERRQLVTEARRYRLLRVELTELRDELQERQARPAGQFMMPGPLADRLQRMLDRGAFGELDAQ